MLYPNLKHWAVVLCLSLNLAAANDQSVDDIQALISSEPEKGLVQAKQFWQDKAVNADNLIAGILMISAYTANAQYAPAKDLLDQFLSLETLAADQTGLLLAMKLNNARKSKSTEGLANTIAHVKTVLVDMNEQKDLASRNKALFELNQEMGFQHYYAAEFETAEPYFIEAYNYIDVDDKKSVSNLLNTIGVVYAQQAKLAQAAQYMFDSLKMLEDNDLPVSISRYQNLGSLYFGLKDYDKTIEYSQKALEIDHKPNKSTVSLYSNMAAAQIEKGLVDEAIKNLKKSIEISTELGTTSASARNNLGYMYKQAGQYDQALEQLNLSAQELDDAENSELRGVSYKSRADVYAAMENYDQALEFYEQAQLIFTQKDLKLKRVELYPEMLSVLEIKNDYTRAYQILQEFKKLNDELTGVESTKQVNEILAKFELEKKEQELVNSELVRDKQQKDIILLNSKNDYDQKIRKLMYVLLAALVVLFIIVYRSWRFRGKVNQVLLDKNNRIENQHAELSTLNSQLQKQIEIDVLTGLKNRRYITQMIAEESAKDIKAQKAWCLMVIDLDDFKSINDLYGHQRGDEVLIQFAHCLEKTKGKNDVVARWGGEEFLWLAEVVEETKGSQWCDLFQSNLKKQTWFRDEERGVTCSMGFSSFPLIDLNFEDWEAALRLADYALYQAKNSGKNTWTGFEIIDSELEYDEINDIEGLVNGHRLKVLNKNK